MEAGLQVVVRVEERRLNAIAHLFTCGEGDYLIALPLVQRSAGEVLTGWNDATSVYGYGGPVASHESMPNQHHWLANRIRAEGIDFKQCSNAFLKCSHSQKLQELADSLTAHDLSRLAVGKNG